MRVMKQDARGASRMPSVMSKDVPGYTRSEQLKRLFKMQKNNGCSSVEGLISNSYSK